MEKIILKPNWKRGKYPKKITDLIEEQVIVNNWNEIKEKYPYMEKSEYASHILFKEPIFQPNIAIYNIVKSVQNGRGVNGENWKQITCEIEYRDMFYFQQAQINGLLYFLLDSNAKIYK